MSLKLFYFNMRALAEAPHDNFITNFPRLEKFLDDISSIDTISKYLDNRPELIDVSVEPKLLINGVAHHTGTNQT